MVTLHDYHIDWTIRIWSDYLICMCIKIGMFIKMGMFIKIGMFIKMSIFVYFRPGVHGGVRLITHDIVTK